MPSPNLANSLSITRIILVVPILIAAGLGERYWLVGLFGLALFTDAIDGTVARKLDQVSDFGSRLDSWGDALLLLSSPLILWLYMPEVYSEETAYLIAGLVAIVAPLLVGFIKFGRLTSYHTYLAKLMSWAAGIGFCLLLAGVGTQLFRIAIIILAVSAAEEILISLVLRRYRDNIPSVMHALKISTGDGSEDV